MTLTFRPDHRDRAPRLSMTDKPDSRGPQTATQTAHHPAAPMNGPVHDARQLTGPDQTGYIRLDGKLYTLRITRAGKLILTK